MEFIGNLIIALGIFAILIFTAGMILGTIGFVGFGIAYLTFAVNYLGVGAIASLGVGLISTVTLVSSIYILAIAYDKSKIKPA